jgi:hypothetical protein
MTTAACISSRLEHVDGTITKRIIANKRQDLSTNPYLFSRNESADSEPNLASPLCHEGQQGGSISSEGCESQIGMKRRKECGDGSPTVSYGIRRQLDHLIRNNFLSRASLSFNGREAPSFCLPGSTEGVRVLIHSYLMTRFGPQLQA